MSILSGARVLAELDDNRTRFADAKAVKAYAGAPPVTRASRRSHVVVARTVKNRRLAAVGYMWAFAALRSQEPRAVNGQPGITVGHEDLRVFLDSSTTSEVFAMFKTHRGQQRS